ncbi:hypothetical protein [Pontiella sulfatireligans]|uniref:Leucine rich repeat variant n=1 Tax=Pontiella sulfatireligans TaxID=2750658 RepID=A0A6C2UM13_9BACT|nr:hypothetical protein [Pontiella sulfatireligans]VGO21310.1 hypothetical protein SCARR_03382 [Pontiella sulfatireligans]
MPAQIEKDELLKALRKDGPRKVVQQYRHNLLPSRVLIDLYSEHPERDVLLFLALYPTVPSQVLEDLGDACPDPEIQAAVATNPRCTHLLLVRMARDGGAPVRAALAANKLQNTKITAKLLNDPDLFVRASLAGNGSITATYRTALALDPEPAVRTALAGTAKLPPELVHTLSSDESAVVRANLYAYGKVDADTLLGWAQSDDPEAQRMMLNRNKLSPEIVKALSLSPDPVVQKTILPLYEPTPQELLAKAESENEALRSEAARHEKLPAEIQHLLATDPLAEVRAALAGNPAIEEEVALCIAASNDPIACKALAGNPQLPESAKTELCHHEADEVRLQMAYRDDLAGEQLDILANQHNDLNLIGHLAMRGVVFAGTSPERLEALLVHKRPALRIFAATAQRLTHAQVRKLMRDDSAKVRLALCTNPILTRMALEELSKDWNKTVVAAAQKHLEQLPPEGEEENDFDDEQDEPSLVSRIVRFFTD